MPRFVFTCQPDAVDLALTELKKADPGLSVFKWLEAGLGICETELSFAEYSNALQKTAPVFVRHIAPADFETDMSGLNRISDLAIAEIAPGKTFSVQVRALSLFDRDARRAATEAVSAPIEAAGLKSDRAKPECIISVILGEKVYFGLSSPEENLSSWPGGMRRFARIEGTASRAEFKLLEAFELYSSLVPCKGKALDLGAAPGGWTRVLAEKGFFVTAVDPANLDPAVLSLKNVTHFKGTSQQYLLDHRGNFDIVVNDMKLDIPDSARVMADCAECLAPEGLAIMTFKLKPKKWTAQINAGLSILEKSYKIVALKQLFHNRSEVTAVLAHKE